MMICAVCGHSAGNDYVNMADACPVCKATPFVELAQSTEPTCDMSSECTDPVTHIGEKGYVYCKAHGVDRRKYGYERTRAMRLWEIDLIRAGEQVPSYRPIRKPRPAA